ncbi:CRISPR-associated protein Cas4 [Brevibacillus thermoruber]|uniref:CRISPR-associated exonuclease Cas4 n=1 Tax=Brevibacillus thermoruber TaxID=33942 RepID=A0A9X3TVR5_9BACL|nr:CRISPR-associated protein Cas4 [Brevibacillus thermoruber]MDA5111053.1 CRISPR-associated protein Cas4 [Brevibacillus thermoruber]
MEIRATDLKQFVFCPRYIYFTYVQPVPKVPTLKMIQGRVEHIEHQNKERRRGLRSYNLVEGARHFHYPVYAERLGLRGKVDLVIETKSSSGQRYFPIECKNTNRGIRNNIVYQLVAYALALEEMTNSPVHLGYIYLLPEKKAYPIPITQARKQHVKRMITMIRHIVENEYFPEPRSRARCATCELQRYCNDLDTSSTWNEKQKFFEEFNELWNGRCSRMKQEGTTIDTEARS